MPFCTCIDVKRQRSYEYNKLIRRYYCHSPQDNSNKYQGVTQLTLVAHTGENPTTRKLDLTDRHTSACQLNMDENPQKF